MCLGSSEGELNSGTLDPTALQLCPGWWSVSSALLLAVGFIFRYRLSPGGGRLAPSPGCCSRPEESGLARSQAGLPLFLTCLACPSQSQSLHFQGSWVNMVILECHWDQSQTSRAKGEMGGWFPREKTPGRRKLQKAPWREGASLCVLSGP